MPDLPPVPFSPDLSALAARGVQRRWRRGQSLIIEGSRDDTLFIIHEGRLRAYSAAANGREITFGVYGPGDYLGEMSLDGQPRSANVEALDPAVCTQVTRRTLELFIAERPAFAFELLSKVIRRARAATVSARTMALEDVYGRLRGLLESAAQPRTDGTRSVADRMSHQDMANQLGCSREMVSRLLKDLERGGYIGRSGRVRPDWILLKALPARW
ncbi:MAG: Crp/Fnr family transcriptional regulator [Aquabacterium sp.]